MDYKNDRLVMYLHGGSGNHGCEAIVNSTCHMIEDIPKLLVTNSDGEEIHLPFDQYEIQVDYLTDNIVMGGGCGDCSTCNGCRIQGE